jgi:hypothetical protein
MLHHLLAAVARKKASAGPVTYHSSTTAVNTGVTSFPVDKPAGVVEGDLLLVIFVDHNTITVTPPSGWQAVHVAKDDTITLRSLYVWWKVAGGAEPAEYSFTRSSTSNFGQCVMMRFSGVDPDWPMHSFNIAVATLSLAHTMPGGATGFDNALVLRWLLTTDDRLADMATPGGTAFINGVENGTSSNDRTLWVGRDTVRYGSGDTTPARTITLSSGTETGTGYTAFLLPQMAEVVGAVIASESSGTGSGTTATVTKPSGTADGDLLVAVVSAAQTISIPAGWTEVTSLQSWYIDRSMAVFVKEAGGSEPADYTVSISNESSFHWYIARVTGADTGAAAIGATASDFSTTAVNDISVPEITTTRGGSLVFVVTQIDDDANAIYFASGYERMYYGEQTASVDLSMLVCKHRKTVAARTFPAQTMRNVVNEENATIVFEIMPPA